MKAQINVLIPLNVNVYIINKYNTSIHYRDGNLEVLGHGRDINDALNDFRIRLAEELHALANKPHTSYCGFPTHREWGITLKSH